MIVGRVLNKFINVFTGLFGMATVVLLLVIYLNNVIPGNFLGESAVTLGLVKNYTALGTVLCAGLEFTLKRNIILAAVFAAILVGTVVLMLCTDFAM